LQNKHNSVAAFGRFLYSRNMKRIFLRYFFITTLAAFSLGAFADTSPCNVEVKSSPIGNSTIEYLKVGKGEPILLLHGLFAQKEQWSELACQLASAGYLVVAPDLPGFGKSIHFPIIDYKLENQAEILHQFTKTLNIQKFDLAGSSMGGAIASIYARNYRSQIRSLAFIGAPLGVGSWSAQVKGALYQGINPFIPITADQFNLEMRLLFYKPPTVPEAIQEGLIADYQKSNRHYQQIWDIVNLYMNEIEKSPSSPVPTLIMWGKEDGIFEVEDIRRLEQKYPKNRHYIVEKGGHLLMLDKPQEVSATYIQFLKSK
jgi:abhydrolase domain-containing protein 6